MEDFASVDKSRLLISWLVEHVHPNSQSSLTHSPLRGKGEWVNVSVCVCVCVCVCVRVCSTTRSNKTQSLWPKLVLAYTHTASAADEAWRK